MAREYTKNYRTMNCSKIKSIILSQINNLIFILLIYLLLSTLNLNNVIIVVCIFCVCIYLLYSTTSLLKFINEIIYYSLYIKIFIFDFLRYLYHSGFDFYKSLPQSEIDLSLYIVLVIALRYEFSKTDEIKYQADSIAFLPLIKEAYRNLSNCALYVLGFLSLVYCMFFVKVILNSTGIMVNVINYLCYTLFGVLSLFIAWYTLNIIKDILVMISFVLKSGYKTVGIKKQL